MDKSQKCNIEPKKPGMKEYTLCDFLSIKLNPRKNYRYRVVRKVNLGGLVKRRGLRVASGDTSNVLTDGLDHRQMICCNSWS